MYAMTHRGNQPPEAAMTDISPRSRSNQARRSLREIFTRAARHYRIERRSLPDRGRQQPTPTRTPEGAA